VAPNNERCGTRCRDREIEEQAKRDTLSIAVTNEAATDRAAKLDAAATRVRLDKAPAMQNANPGAAVLLWASRRHELRLYAKQPEALGGPESAVAGSGDPCEEPFGRL
jgi:hypothetical protein